MCIKYLLFFIITFLFTTNHIKSQSTCPVIQDQQQQQQQKCKCGIKTDGQIYIYCARKSLTKIPKFIRSSILYDELILSGNQITQIQNSSFNGIRVKNLYLDDNRISYIDNQAFSELANYLEQLVIDVDQTAVTSGATQLQVQIKPPDSIFENLLNLKILKLNGFYMNELNNTVFNKTRKLEQLYLVNCKLMIVNRLTFASIDNTIKEINLDDNYLNEASLFNLFKQVNFKFKRLQLLSLSRNRIKRLNSIKDVIEARDESNDNEVSITRNSVSRGDNSGGGEVQLQAFAVDLSYNELSYVDTNAFYSIDRRITKLKINNNELTNVKFIKNFINLRELYLDYNRVSNLNEFQFKYLTKLEILSLKGNLLHTISSPNTFTGLNLCLKKLNLAKNSLKYVSDSVFKQTSKLKELNLEKNELGKNLTEQTFSGLESELKLLNLEDNLLNNNDLKSIVDLRNVETLYLSSNNLTNDYENDNSNGNMLDKYVNLTNLYLDRNNFKRIPYFKSAALNNSLLTLSLESNQICHVNTNNIKRAYSKLKYLNLNINKLNCDCNLVDFWLYTQKYLIIDDDNRINLYWKCKTPYRLSDRLFTSVNINEFICDKNDIKLPNDCEFDYDFDQQQQLEKGLLIDKSDSSINRGSQTINTTSTSSTTTTATSISTNNDASGGLSTSSRLLLKYLNINQLSADTIKITWQINNDDQDFIENDSIKRVDKTANKLISFFKITYRQLINKNHHSHDVGVNDEYDNDDESSVENNNSYDNHVTSTSTTATGMTTEYGQLHAEVLLNNQREFIIDNLKLNKIYELCFYIISEFKTNYEEKTCHLIKTNSAISSYNNNKQKVVNLLSSGMHSNVGQTTKLLQTVSGNSAISEFKFETKQIIIGSLIGAMSVLLIVFFIFYLIRNSNKNNNESMNNLNGGCGGDQKQSNDDQHFQLQQQQQKTQIQPKQFDLLTSYDHLGQGTTRPILFIRPINNITTTLAQNTNNNNTATLNTNNTSVGSLNAPYYSTSQCCYTLPPMLQPPNMIPPPPLQPPPQQQQQQSQTQLNRCKKQTSKKQFSIKNFFKKRNKSDSHQTPSSQQQQQQFSDKQIMTMTTMCKNQQQLQQQYLLSEIALFPSYIIRQPSGTSSSSSSSSSSSTSSSSSCTPHDTTTSSAFTTFTPMLSTTLETTLDPNQQQLSNINNNDPNYLMSQQHMYHEITDTLLTTNKTSQHQHKHQHQQIASFRNDIFNTNNTNTISTTPPLFYDNNKLKELFI